jgi:hypothetical protein
VHVAATSPSGARPLGAVVKTHAPLSRNVPVEEASSIPGIPGPARRARACQRSDSSRDQDSDTGHAQPRRAACPLANHSYTVASLLRRVLRPRELEPDARRVQLETLNGFSPATCLPALCRGPRRAQCTSSGPRQCTLHRRGPLSPRVMWHVQPRRKELSLTLTQCHAAERT